VAAVDAAWVDAAAKLCLRLRQKEIAVRFVGAMKRDKVFKYSTATGLSKLVLVGEDEVKSGVYGLRDGETRQERKLSESELVELLSR
jgi:histidyl-tRNA synthetase